MGFGSVVIFLPDKKWGVVVMGNSHMVPAAAQVLTWHLIDDLLGVPDAERFDWDAHCRKQFAAGEMQGLDQEREKLYPGAAKITHSLPIESYAGEYSHPAYQTITVTEEEGTLRAEVMDRTWPHVIDFFHVSGEHLFAIGTPTERARKRHNSRLLRMERFIGLVLHSGKMESRNGSGLIR